MEREEESFRFDEEFRECVCPLWSLFHFIVASYEFLYESHSSETIYGVFHIVLIEDVKIRRPPNARWGQFLWKFRLTIMTTRRFIFNALADTRETRRHDVTRPNNNTTSCYCRSWATFSPGYVTKYFCSRLTYGGVL